MAIQAKDRRSARRGAAGMLCLSVLTAACGAEDAGRSQVDGGAGPTRDGGAGGEADGAVDRDGGADAGDDGGSYHVTPGDAGGPADAASCGASPFQANRIPANVLLVIDKSGSMKKTPTGFTANKWDALTGALEGALGAVQDDLSFGVDLYPVGAEACELPEGSSITVGVDQGAAHVEQIVTTLEAITPAGQTPTAAALSRALGYFTAGDGAALEGDKYVVLATDGGPNCNDGLTCTMEACTVNMEGTCYEPSKNCCDESVGGPGAAQFCLDASDTLGAVEALSAAGIATVVVGIPGSESFSSLLDSLAVAGGMPSGGATDYFAVTADGTGAGGLADVLTRITRQLIRSCDFQLASVPPDLGKLNVQVDDATIPRDAADGWMLDTTTDPPTVRLQGATCTAVQADGATRVDVTFGCPTVTIL